MNAPRQGSELHQLRKLPNERVTSSRRSYLNLMNNSAEKDQKHLNALYLSAPGLRIPSSKQSAIDGVQAVQYGLESKDNHPNYTDRNRQKSQRRLGGDLAHGGNQSPTELNRGSPLSARLMPQQQPQPAGNQRLPSQRSRQMINPIGHNAMMNK